MRKRMKKILAIMLASSLTVGMIPAVAMAEDSVVNTEQTAGSENAAASDADTTEEQTASTQDKEEAAKEAALEAAKKAEESNAEQPEEQSQEAAAAKQSVEARSIDWESLKEDIAKAIFLNPETTVLELSDYSLETTEAEAATDEVLSENNAATLVETEVVEGSDGQADALTISLDPELKAVAEEVNELADGDGGDGSQQGPIPMDEEQRQQILSAYAAYQTYVEENPDYFGLQTPFFTQKEKNDTKWGPLGSLLVIAGISEEAIEAGYVDFQTLYGTVQLFAQGNQAAVKNMGSTLLAVKDQALSQIKDGMSTVEKLLVLNEWLANWSNFDMAMLMGMSAPEPAESDVDPNIQGLWEGNQFGPLCLRKGVCLGYSNAYTYLVQWAFPEIYKNADGTWKTKEEVNYTTKEVQGVNEDGTKAVDENKNPVMVKSAEWDPSAPYMIDYVRITYDADVTMFGEKQDKFDSDHYWNAVKVDGKWYYIDTCYIDIYIECMVRDRVETDGNMNHLYFMISDPTVRELYDGNYSNIDTLYENIATDTTYESAWMHFARSPISVVDDKYYYFYDSTDMIGMLGQFGGMGGASTQAESDSGSGNWGDWEEDSEYKLVYRDGAGEDAAKDFTTLVDFVAGTVLDPSSGTMVENDLIKDLYAKHQEYQSIYPSVAISGTVYNGLFYFNIANCVLTYNLQTGEVKRILEYNEVSGKRDLSVALGGMGFSVVPNDSEDKDITLYNKPIASMTIKNDGKMYVSVATNLGWISGKTDMNDQENYGYAYEESNYNPEYNTYYNYNQETNDNDEFMWSANLVDVKDMSELTGSSHNYTDVTVAPSCETEGYTESRCADCGLIQGTEKTNITEAVGHHYVPFEEQYYTKDEDENWNTGKTNVCVRCLDAKDELESGDPTGHTYGEPTFTWSEDHSTCTATFDCEVCKDAKVDCLQGENNPSKQVECKVEKTVPEGFECSKGGQITYTATCEYNGKEWKTEEAVDVAAGEHTEKYTSNNDGTHTCKCSVCGAVLVENEACTYDENGVCTKCGAKEISVAYKSHVQTYGDNDWVENGATSGTIGEAKRMEAIYIKLENAPEGSSIQYKAHVESIGWQDWVKDGDKAGTSGQSKRVEAIQIKLSGSIADEYDVYYRVHAQNFGWMDWAKNGESAGTAGFAYRLEAFEIQLVKKGEKAPGNTETPFKQKLVQYQVHVQNIGTQSYVYDGAMAGTEGKKYRLEAIRMNLPTNDGKSGIKYRVHVQNDGWQGWKKNGQLAGTEGKSYRLEAIQIELEGDMKDKYDVYYCVHVQNYGWLDWAKNGEKTGTTGYAYRLEAIKIMLVEKGQDAPESVSGSNKIFYEK